MNPSLTLPTPFRRRPLAALSLAAAVAGVLGVSSAPAANVVHTLTTSGASNWSTATWTGGAPSASTAGDIATYGTAIAATTTLDVNVTIGTLRLTAGSASPWAIAVGAGALTLDGTGITSGNQNFGYADTALIYNSGSGLFTVSPNISLATNTDVGVVFSGGITLAGNITAAANSALTFRNNASSGVVTVDGSIGASGSSIAIANLGAGGSGVVTLNGVLGTSVTTVTQYSSSSGLALTGVNLYTGATILTAGTLTAQDGTTASPGANNFIKALSTGTVNLNGGTLNLRANGSAAGATIITGDGTTGNNVVVAGNAGISMDRVNGSNAGNTYVLNNLTIGASTLTTSSTNTQHLRFAGTTTLTGNATISTLNGNDIVTLVGAVGDGGSGYGLTKTGSATLTLTGANTYTGATHVNTGNFVVSGVSGAINSSVGITITGTGAFGNPGGSSVLQLDNTAGSLERVGNSQSINLSSGGEFRLTQGNTTVNATETVGVLNFGTGSSLVTINSATGRLTTIAADSIARGNLGTGVVRGTSLGNNATNAGRLTLTTAPTGTNFVGTSTANTASGGSSLKNLKIVPWLTGDTSTGGGNFGGAFVTYDTGGSGLRPLNSNEVVTLASGYVATGENVVSNGAVTLTAGSRQFNSLFFTGAATLTAGDVADTLTIDSGAVAGFTASSINGFASVILGNGEGIFNNGANLTVNSPVNVTSSGGLTKGNTGTLILAASNLYTGQTTVNQGTLQLGNGGATGDLGANTANIVLNASTLAVNRSGTTTLVNNISGTGALTVTTTAGTTALTGSNSFSGATTVGNGMTLQAVANAGNTTGGVSSALSPNSGLTLNSNGTAAANVPVLQLRADADTTFNTGTATANSVNGNVAIVGSVQGAALTIDVNQATGAGTNRILTLGNVVLDNTVGGVQGNTVLNVTGGNGYTLQIGGLFSSNRGNNGQAAFFTVNADTVKLIVGAGGIVGSSANASEVTFTGASTATVVGNIVQGGTRGVVLNMNQTGTVILNGNNTVITGGTSGFKLNSGTTVVNNSNGLVNGSIGAVQLGTSTASANNVSLLLGGTNATGTVAGTNGGIIISTAIRAQDTDSGTLTLGGQNTSGLNTFSGNLTLGVTTNTGKSVALQALSGGVVAFTGNILVNGTGAITPGGLVVGDGTHAGVVRLSGVNTYTGGTAVNGGTLIGTTAAALGANSGLSVASGANFAYRPTAAGTANLGTGVLTLAGSNTLGTAVGGTLSQSALTSSSAAVVAGAVTVDVSGIAGVAVTTGTNNLITAASGLNGATFTLGKLYNATNFTIGTFAQTDTAVSLDVTSAAALTSEFWKGGLAGGSNVWALSNGTTASNWASDLAGTNTPLTPGTTATVTFTATGGTNQGAMVLGADVRVAGVVVDDPTAIALNVDGNVLTVGTGGLLLNSASGGATFAAPITLGGAQSWTNNSSNALSVSGSVANGGFLLTATGSGNTTVSGGISGSGGLTKTGAGTLTLSGVNTFSGTVTLSGGVLDLSTTGQLSIGAGTGIAGTGGTINGTGASRILLNSNNTDFGVANGGTLTINAVIANGTQTNLDFFNTTNGTGLVVLTADNTFTGNASIQSGIVSVAKIGNSGVAGNLGTNGTVNFGSTTSTGTLRYTGTGETNNRVLNLAGTTAGAFLEQAGASGLWKFTADLTATGAGAKTLTLLGSTAGTGELAGRIVDSGGGATSVAKLGTGTWTLSGASTYTGTTAIAQGRVNVSTLAVTAGTSSLGNATSAVLLGDATNKGTLAYTGSTATFTRGLTIAAGGGELDTTTSGQTLTVGTGGITSASNGSLTVGGAGNTTITSGISLGTGTVTKEGAGTLNINGAQTYGTLTTSAGTTNVNTALGTGTSTVNANATTNFGASQTLAALNIGAGAVVTLQATPPFAPFGLGAASDFGGSSPAGLAGSAVVPEPGTLGLLALGALGVLGRRRRVA